MASCRCSSPRRSSRLSWPARRSPPGSTTAGSSARRCAWVRATRSSWSWSTRCPSRPTSTSTACTSRPSGESDNVLRHVMAGETAPYRVDLPADHAPGTYWYHSHQHGISEEQVFGGMSGLIVVEGLIDLLPEELRDIEERSFALKDFQLTADGAIVSDNIDSNAPTTRTVNGAVNPSLSIAPGETQLWRLANIGADIWYEVSLEGHPLPRHRRGRQPGLAGVVRREPGPAARQAVRRAGPGCERRDATSSGPWTSIRAVTTTRIPPWPRSRWRGRPSRRLTLPTQSHRSGRPRPRRPRRGDGRQGADARLLRGRRHRTSS